MSWEIELNTTHVEYIYCEETYETERISRVNRKIYSEPSSGYQEPNDDVMEDTYNAMSDHGVFEWVVTARRSGFNTYAEIEDINQTKEPEECETIEQPDFAIKHD